MVGKAKKVGFWGLREYRREFKDRKDVKEVRDVKEVTNMGDNGVYDLN